MRRADRINGLEPPAILTARWTAAPSEPRTEAHWKAAQKRFYRPPL